MTGSERKAKWEELRAKWFRRDNLVIMVLAGILLFIIALPSGKAGRDREPDPESVSALEVTARVSEEDDVSSEREEGRETALTLEDYGEAQEKKLAKLLNSMEGVGKVEVMLTFASSEELVVEKDAQVVRSNTVEKDSEGGTRTISNYEQGDSSVYRNGSQDSAPYVVKTLPPRVEGALVVAEGAGDDTINRNISEVVQALFGVEAERVKVVSGKSL